ncbi:MAG: ABC transporter ATP-binding protein [Anaerolineales bacterium]|nr:ABC transporter ATP-binding protein [Anaerolineales bacterium]
MKAQPIITVEGLRKRYGPVTAVDGISFEVQPGEIFGMVGPNGSGKTTTIECIEGLRQPDEGSLRVLGFNPRSDCIPLRERTGIQLQASNLPERMRVEEALDLFASFYPQPEDWNGLLEELGLADKRRSFFSQLSGGQKQRLYIALALINRPEIVFLDELTTGLDPQARHATWDLVRKVRSRGATVFLTTHFMDEAERLCERVAILDHGRILALDSPANLVAGLGASVHLSFSLNGLGRSETVSPEAIAHTLAAIGAMDGVQKVEREGDLVRLCGQGEELVGAVILALEAARLPYHDIRTEQANLEDVFLALTGRAVRN